MNLFIFRLFVSLAFAGGASFPTHPDPAMTPGDLCNQPTEIRYPEKIKYCARNVSTDLKNEVIRDYDSNDGYSVEQMPRQDFKIDHFIPLCMGGSNEAKNLWPQHKSVYVISDPHEQDLCDKLAAGQITQAEAVQTITQLKMGL